MTISQEMLDAIREAAKLAVNNNFPYAVIERDALLKLIEEIERLRKELGK